jgi:hypothetical protein
VLIAVAVILLSISELPRKTTCVCIRSIDPRPTFESSAAVFVGRALDVVEANGDTGAESPNGVPYFQDSVTFVVEKSWKGSSPDTVRAAIDVTGPECPTRFTAVSAIWFMRDCAIGGMSLEPARVRPS